MFSPYLRFEVSSVFRSGPYDEFETVEADFFQTFHEYELSKNFSK